MFSTNKVVTSLDDRIKYIKTSQDLLVYPILTENPKSATSYILIKLEIRQFPS